MVNDMEIEESAGVQIGYVTIIKVSGEKRRCVCLGIEVAGHYYVRLLVGSYGIDAMNRAVYKIGNNMCIFGLTSEWRQSRRRTNLQ